MKVLILSTFGNYGGAATCSKRLFLALEKHGIDVKLRVLQFYDQESIRPLFGHSIISWIKTRFYFIMERLEVFFAISERKYLFKFSTGSFGFNLLNHPLVREADIIHLHWINFGFINIRELQLLAGTKHVIWTLHDMWAFTGGCHYALHCHNYQATCDDCFYLKRDKLSMHIQANKLNLWADHRFKVMATSTWLAKCARHSKVFRNWDIKVLATPLDTLVFKPLDKENIKVEYALHPDDYYVLFGAVDLNDERKGFKYLLQAIELLVTRLPNLHLITFGNIGKMSSNVKSTFMGHVDSPEKLNEIYNLADVFILPSIQDNLPNTVMEAMAAGLPVVAFDCGGVGDMVRHKESGYLAENRNDKDLAEGILYFNDLEVRNGAGIEARKTIENNFSEEALIPKYMELYDGSINHTLVE